jgi:hypothetical protein
MEASLQLYASIIEELCPCEKTIFDDSFDSILEAKLRNPLGKKARNNHRSEIAGKLFGMYEVRNDGCVDMSERTAKFLKDGDMPAFFKDICLKMQFPSGSAKYSGKIEWVTLDKQVSKTLKIRQFPFIIQLLYISPKKSLTKNEIGYYVLNSLNVLQGNATPKEVLDAVLSDRKNGIIRKIGNSTQNNSYKLQHINEQINLLELANLVEISKDKVTLNLRERKAIKIFKEQLYNTLYFDVYGYDLSTQDERKKFYAKWSEYYSRLSGEAKSGELKTTAKTLIAKTSLSPVTKKKSIMSTVEIGDEGEKYIINYEHVRVEAFDKRLLSKIEFVGKKRGLGYDIRSVFAEGTNPDREKYIEVKTTLSIYQLGKEDSINLTRKEWEASQDYKDAYFIYRVYISKKGVKLHILRDIADKHTKSLIEAVPSNYRLSFDDRAIDDKKDI